MKYNEALQAPILEGATKNYRKAQRREIFGDIENAHKQLRMLLNEILEYMKGNNLDNRIYNIIKDIERSTYLFNLSFHERYIVDAINDICKVDSEYGNKLRSRLNKIKKLTELTEPIQKGYDEFKRRDENKIGRHSGDTDDKLSIEIANKIMVPAYKKGVISTGYKNQRIPNVARKYNQKLKEFIKMIGPKRYQELQNKYHGKIKEIYPIMNSKPTIEIVIENFKTKKISKYYIAGYENICSYFGISKDAVDKFIEIRA